MQKVFSRKMNHKLLLSLVLVFLEEPEVDYSIVTSSPVGKARIDASTEKLIGITPILDKENEIEKYLKQVEDQAKLKEFKFKKLVDETILLVKDYLT